jgi:Protein of unknown function (DUF4232)
MIRMFRARRLTAALAVGGVALLIPVAGLAASSGPPPPAATPRCGAGSTLVWASTLGGGFAGGEAYEVEVSNVGKRTCTLQGVPGLAAIASSGHLVGSKIPASSKGRLITLRAGATAHVSMEIFFGGAVCAHPVKATAFFYLPGQRAGKSTGLSAQACAGHRGGGVLAAEAIAGGVGVPLYTD